MTAGPAAQRCLVCATPLSMARAAHGERTCGNAACACTLRSTPAHARCRVCGRPLAADELAARVCGASSPNGGECRRRRLADYRAVERERQAHVAATAAALRDRSAATIGVDRPGDYPVAVIPSLTRPATRLPARRRRAIRRHLEEIVARAVALGPPTAAIDAPVDVSPTPAVVATLGAACATCRGYCCRQGGAHAFLSAERMQRHLAEHPELAPADVVDGYMRRVRTTTIADSCVFHGVRGCALPREMRSDTCNRFHCGALAELRRALPADGSARAFVAAAEARTIDGAAFVAAGARRPVDPTPA